jgi:hypothetical protein
VHFEPKSCAQHPDFPALAVCSLCGRPMCGLCHNTSLVGYAVCKGCPVIEKMTPRTQWERSSGLSAVPGYLHTAVEVITSPRMFFIRYPKGKTIDALLFGYLSLTIAFTVSRIWGYFFLGRFEEALSEVAKQAEVSYHTATWLYFGLTPISSLIGLMVFIGLLFVGLKAMGGKNVTWPNVTWIGSMASASLLFQIIPPVLEFPVGQLLAMLWLLNILFLATQVRFELTFFRAMIATLIPFWVLTTMAQ